VTSGVACSECGFDPSTVSVTDAVVTLRTLPRRWRELADRVADDDPDAAARYRAAADDAGRYAAVADDAEAADPDAWKDRARLDALREQVHAGVHELRAAERAAG
jgi:hypothetical protein